MIRRGKGKEYYILKQTSSRTANDRNQNSKGGFMSYLMAIWRRRTEGFLGFVGKRKGLIWVIRMKKREKFMVFSGFSQWVLTPLTLPSFIRMDGG